jgi:uncharacterized membrane protein
MNTHPPYRDDTQILCAGNHRKGRLFLVWHLVCSIQINFPKIMATKKTATKTTASTPTPVEKTATPVAKKAAKKAAAKKVAPVAAKKEATPAATKKVVAPAAAKKVAVKKVTAVKPSLDVIARAAYLNYRRRVEQGLPGNSQGDWLEAERQFAG